MNARAVAGVLNLRAGEVPLFLALGSYLFLATATVTLLVAVKNGLFLSVYPSSYIPYAMMLAALLTALVSLTYSSLSERAVARDVLARRFLAFMALSLVGCWLSFHITPASVFGIYLWLVTANALLLAQGWSYVGGSLTGRQGKRLMPIIGMGGSVASVVAGVALTPLVLALGTDRVLLVAAGLLLAALALPGLAPTPLPEAAEVIPEGALVGNPIEHAARGFRSLRREPLLRLLAAAVVLVVITSTLIDYMFKVSLQDAFGRDRITVLYGLLAGSVGAVSLVLQLLASRVVFPRFGVSGAARAHTGILALNAAGVAAFGGVPLVFLLQVMDDSLRYSIQRPAEQVSLLPFPRRVKDPAYTAIGGVLRPLARALTAWASVLLSRWPASLPLTAMVAAGGATLLYGRHRGLYLAALERALARHSVDLAPSSAPLVIDREGLHVVDEALKDPEPTVVIFALTMLTRLPASDAVPLLLPLLAHPLPEVRSEAVRALASFDEADLGTKVRATVVGMLEREQSPEVLSALLATTGPWDDARGEARLVAFLEHASTEARGAALVALGRRGWQGTDAYVGRLLASDIEDERAAGIAAVSALDLTAHLPAVARAAESESLRGVALDTLEHMGAAAVPFLAGITTNDRLDLALRRGAAVALAGIDDEQARAHLMEALWIPGLSRTAIHELRRLRQAGKAARVGAETLAPLLRSEAARSLCYASAASLLQARSPALGERAAHTAEELAALRDQGVRRAMDLLALSHDPERVRVIEQGLATRDPVRQSSALELLEGMLDYEDAAPVVRLCETVMERPGPAAERPGAIDGIQLGNGLEELRADERWFPHALALYVLADSQGGPTTDAWSEEERKMIPLIQKVMVLKGTELFRTFPGEELAGIAGLASETHLDEGETLFEQGDDGDAFYVVMGGSVRIVRDGREVARLGAREGFGEMAILDHGPRSATAQAAEPTALLRIDRESFDRLVDRNPAVGKGIYRVLSRRLRATLAQVGTAY